MDLNKFGMNVFLSLFKNSEKYSAIALSNTKSGIKLQLTFDYLNQTLNKLNLTEGVRSDQGYRDYLNDVSENDLLLFDLGYFVPNCFKQLDEAGAYFISRYKSDTHVYDIQTNQKIELLEILENQSVLERV